MPRLTATRTAQRELNQEFVFTYNGWVVDSVDGAKKTMGSSPALSTDPSEPALNGPAANTIVFECLPMPVGAVIVGGAVIVETAYVGPTAATVSLGTAGNTTALANAVSLLAAGRTALTLTVPLVSNGGQNLRATIAYTVANATAGKVRLRVNYTIDGRADDNVGA